VTLFDRYLLKRYWHVFAIGFVAAYGLYVVFDAFSNADEFQEGTEGSTITMLLKMGEHYFFQSFLFFDMSGPILIVLSAIGVFALLQRSSELYPVLSAGTPSWRLAVPIVLATLGAEVLLAVNQELIIPAIAARLHSGRDSNAAEAQDVQPARDYVTNIEVSGDKLRLNERKILEARILLPVPTQVIEPTTLRADEAIQVPAKGNRPAGWLLRDPLPRHEDLLLTDVGRQRVLKAPSSEDIFVVTDISIEQLHNRTKSFKYLSTSQLLERIRNPAYGIVSIRNQAAHLHERLTRPIMTLISVLVAIPLTLRRESHSLLLNIAICTLVLGVLFVVTQASLHFGRLNMMEIELAAWLPVVIFGTAAAWVSGLVQT